MALHGLSIEKSTLWRGSQQTFSNVYFYEGPLLDTAGAQALVDGVVTAEKFVHSTEVNFQLGRVWTAGGTAAQNETLLLRDLAGVGSQDANGTLDREATFLINFKTSRPSSTGKPVTLKKYIHACSDFGSISFDWMAGMATIPQGIRDVLAEYGASVRRRQVNGVEYALSARTSDRLAGAPSVYPYIEHHEFTY